MTRDERTFMEAALRQQEEMEKCKNSPVYFYNTYVKPKEQPDLSEEDYDFLVKIEQAKRNNRRVGYFNGRKGPVFYEYPATPDECVKP